MLPTSKYRPLFAKIATEHLWDARLLEAQAMVESSGNPLATKQEPAHEDASYGLLQVMGNTAKKLGLVGEPTQLLDPLVGIEYGMRALVDIVRWRRFEVPWAQGAYKSVLLPLPIGIQTVLATYNGGFRGNPREDGTYRCADYIGRVATFYEAVLQEVA